MTLATITATTVVASAAAPAVLDAQSAQAGARSAEAGVATAGPAPSQGYVPHRVWRSGEGATFRDFESMVAALARADIVFLGEMHDDPGTHALQRAVLEGLARRRDRVVLSLEMFERDVQPALDAYLAGERDEAAFLADARPWPNYGTDYRPLVTFAMTQGWPVVAANVPRRLAQVVSRGGLGALDTIPIADLAFIARERSCPRDAYWDRFRAAMGDMGGHGAGGDAGTMIERFYGAQCIKDETMAESNVRAHEAAGRGSLVVHVNGAFHSDYRLGTAARVRRRLGDGVRMAVVRFVPSDDLDAVDGASLDDPGDWIVFTLRPESAPAAR